MNPATAICHLLDLGWTEQEIAIEAATTQPTINRIKHGANPSYETGARLVDLVRREKTTPKRKRSTA